MPYFSLFIFLCHILSFGSYGLNFEFIRRGYGFLMNSKKTFTSSGVKPILNLKISVTNFGRFQYFADINIKIELIKAKIVSSK